MNESEFRRLVRAAVGQPPPPLAPERLHAYLVERAERQRHRVTAAVAFGLAVVAVVVLFGGYRLLNLSQRPTTPVAPPSAIPASPTTGPTPVQSTAPPQTPTPTPSAARGSVLVFQQGASTGAWTTSIVGPDGVVRHTASANPDQATFTAAYAQYNHVVIEAGALITTTKSWSAFDVLEPDGTVTPTAPSLAALLGGNAHANSPNTLSDCIMLDSGTLLALESSPNSTDVSFVKVDLSSGTITPLLKAHPNRQMLGSPLRPVALSRDRTKVFLFVLDATINSTTATGLSLVTLDLSTGEFTSKGLPTGIDPATAAVNDDGTAIGYEVSGVNNGYASWTTHLYNVQSGRDVTLAGEAISADAGIRFSPDGGYLYEAGHYAADTRKAGMALQIISTASNSIVRQVDLPGVQNLLDAFGWTGDHTIIYTTNSSSTGIYDPMMESTHSIDASTGTTFDYPKNLGELVGVINYQQ